MNRGRRKRVVSIGPRSIGVKPPLHPADTLTLWRRKLPWVEHALLPSLTPRPNPLVVGDFLFASVFSPGAVCTLDRKTGALRWRIELGGLGAASVYYAGGILFAKTARTLLALNPSSGETLWTFSPYDESGEWMYSSPVVAHGKLFIGDRRGYLHCLEASTGRPVWKCLTSRARNNDVNSTPVVMNHHVIAATNAALAVALDPETGTFLWKQRLDGPVISGLTSYRRQVAATANSLYLLDPRSGHIRQRLTWPGMQVWFAAPSRGHLLVLFSVSHGGFPETIGIISSRRVVGTLRIDPPIRHFRYAEETGLMYAGHWRGLTIFRPSDGRILCRIELKTTLEVGPVDVKGGVIYALTGTGTVYALRHPLIQRV